VAGSGDEPGTGTHPDPDGLPGRPDDTSGDRSVAGYLPRLDYPALGIETVLFRISVSGPTAAVAADVRGSPFTDVYEVAGSYDVLAIGRFRDRDELAATLARLTSDPRVGAVSTEVVLEIACEYDLAPLLDCED